ncbi:hypothetical protein BJF79_43290 [Actinomadura sp. CNU-125]|uniref:hypothetical protein n=1 Tax=Actinomadura sp. CNU-125 TaxID=1904961 RepID=UPI000969AB3C|nr:hypothetical protein [Actinomadura sp. CNU-125]OLT26636.1 hypothetical protein BJF79_43290 [Actinomadura sp. CNU-125]
MVEGVRALPGQGALQQPDRQRARRDAVAAGRLVRDLPPQVARQPRQRDVGAEQRLGDVRAVEVEEPAEQGRRVADGEGVRDERVEVARTAAPQHRFEDDAVRHPVAAHGVPGPAVGEVPEEHVDLAGGREPQQPGPAVGDVAGTRPLTFLAHRASR